MSLQKAHVVNNEGGGNVEQQMNGNEQILKGPEGNSSHNIQGGLLTKVWPSQRYAQERLGVGVHGVEELVEGVIFVAFIVVVEGHYWLARDYEGRFLLDS